MTKPLIWRKRRDPAIVALVDELFAEAVRLRHEYGPDDKRFRAIGRRIHYLIKTGAEPPAKERKR